MSILATAFAAMTALTPVPSTASESPPVLAAAMQGDWALVGRTCAPGPSDSGNVRITPSSIVEFELVATVTAISPLPDNVISVALQVDSGTAQFPATQTLSLSDDGERLLVGAPNDQSIYRRCR